MKENSVEKWAGCKHSLSFGLFAGDEAGYALKEEGFNENYGCEHPEIVGSGRFAITSFPEAGKITKAAQLYGIGKFDDPKVIEALTLTCSECPLYEKSPAKSRVN